jgi:hypothetical protein
VNKIYKPKDCKFAVGELVRVKERVMGGYERDVLYAEAGDTGVVVQVPQTTRPMAVQVKMDEPRRPYGVMVFSEDLLEPL